MSGGIVANLRRVANVVVAPFSWSVSEIARPIGHILAGAVNYSDVVAQNQKLRYELGIAELHANEAWSLERQLSEMTTKLNLPFIGALPTVAAQVTSLSPTNFSASITISKGLKQGVLVGMPVVANGGLVGIVISSGPNASTVRLITDVNSSIGATFGNGSSSLIISGNGLNNGLGATSVPLSDNVAPGTVFSTDGLNGSLYPPGLPIATVSKATLTPGAATFDLTLKPTADLRNLTYVDVLLWEPST
jgi:rod shape-determining protein MreC